MKKTFLPIFITGLLISCYKDIKLDVGRFERQPVVNALICAGDSVTVCLSYSYPSYMEPVREKINGAFILMSDSKGNTCLFKQAFSYDWQSGIYKTDIIAQVGELYYLRVLVDGYDTLRASTTIPQPVKVDSVKYTIIPTRFEGDRFLEVTAYFKDPAGPSFYLFNLHVTGGSYEPYWVDSIQNIMYHFSYRQDISSQIYWEICDPVIGVDENANVYNKLLVFNDELFDTGVYGLKFRVQASDYSRFCEYDSVIVSPVLYSITPELYYYAASVNEQGQINGNPFTEPVRSFSNISNGRGIFAGMSCTTGNLRIATHYCKERR